jgi:hypothetical protein
LADRGHSAYRRQFARLLLKKIHARDCERHSRCVVSGLKTGALPISKPMPDLAPETMDPIYKVMREGSPPAGGAVAITDLRHS